MIETWRTQAIRVAKTACQPVMVIDESNQTGMAVNRMNRLAACCTSNMLSNHHPLSALLILLALVWLGVAPSQAQTSVDALRKALREQAAFTAEDLSGLEQGRVVAKLLSVKDKREVAVCGVVRLPVPPAAFLQFTRDNVAQQNNRAILKIGKFSSPPTIEDLQALTLEYRDIEDLKRCAATDCNLKMSAAMIERVRNEVNWNAPDYRAQATLVFRQMLLEYVRDYLARGTAALIEYSDRSHGVSLDEELRSLLDASPYFNQFAPEFTKYLRSFPPRLSGAENFIFWSKIKFGLKPVVTITHVVIYPRPANTAPQVLVASKQIYANHYFDSSLAMSAFINFPTTGPNSDSYLLYMNRSRADALGGLFSGLKRSLVENEAMGSLQSILQEQRLKLEAGSGVQPGSANRSSTEVNTQGTHWLAQHRFRGMHLFWWLLGITVIIVAVCWLSKRSARRRSSET